MRFEVSPIAKLEPEWLALLEAAARVQPRAYAPYSRFKVASSILDEHGRVHVGVNVELCNYSGTSCAERNASTRMVAEGGTQIRKLLVLTPSPEPTFPCGYCLQAIQEFASDTVIVGVNQSKTLFSKATLADLFPAAYDRERLEKGQQ